jgi:hypothetical protein
VSYGKDVLEETIEVPEQQHELAFVASISTVRMRSMRSRSTLLPFAALHISLEELQHCIQEL